MRLFTTTTKIVLLLLLLFSTQNSNGISEGKCFLLSRIWRRQTTNARAPPRNLSNRSWIVKMCGGFYVIERCVLVIACRNADTIIYSPWMKPPRICMCDYHWYTHAHIHSLVSYSNIFFCFNLKFEFLGLKHFFYFTMYKMSRDCLCIGCTTSQRHTTSLE